MPENQASLKPLDVTYELFQSVGHGGRRRVHRRRRAVAVTFVAVSPASRGSPLRLSAALTSDRPTDHTADAAPRLSCSDARSPIARHGHTPVGSAVVAQRNHTQYLQNRQARGNVIEQPADHPHRRLRDGLRIVMRPTQGVRRRRGADRELAELPENPVEFICRARTRYFSDSAAALDRLPATTAPPL